MAIAKPSNPVSWLQVWSLASVQGAISLTWIAYSLYLPKFIEQVFGYPADQALQFAALLFAIESAISVIIEPVFGGLSDRWQRWYSTKMPLIGAGVIASTVVLILLPTSVIFGGSNKLMQVVLPSLAILWAMVMATFRAPVLSLLGGFAGSSQLPLAASILTLVGGFISSIKPLASKFILGMGAPATFTIASITLLGGVASLRWAMIYLPQKIPTEVAPEINESPRHFSRNLAIVILVGASIGLGMRLLMGDILPRTIKTEIVGFTGFPFELLFGAILITQGLIALGTGRLSKFIDNRLLMIFAFGGITASLVILSLGYGAIASIIVILFLLICMSAVNNGMVAFALTMVPKNMSGLTVGLFFSGLSGVNAIFGYFVPRTGDIFLPNLMLLTAIAFLIAGIGISLGDRLKPN